MKGNIDLSAKKRKSRAVSTFLKKTYELLNDSSNYHAVKWSATGVGLVIIDEEIFSRDVLSKYFKHSNYSSFVRQLNMYNFHKIREGTSQSYFHHEYFCKHDRDLLGLIKRKPEKKKKRDDSDDEDCGSADLDVEQENEPVETRPKSFMPHYLAMRGSEPSIKNIISSRNIALAASSSSKNVESEKMTKHGESMVYHSHSGEQRSSLICSNNDIVEVEMDDDKLSINGDIADHIPKFPTRELIYPSKHNLYPIPMCNIQTYAFSMFY